MQTESLEDIAASNKEIVNLLLKIDETIHEIIENQNLEENELTKYVTDMDDSLSTYEGNQGHVTEISQNYNSNHFSLNVFCLLMYS